MRYLCVHCDHRFEEERDDGKTPRCPKCMRQGGVERLGSGARSRRPRWLVPAIAGAAVLGIGAAYGLWAWISPAAVEGEPPLEPLSVAEVRGYAKNAGVKQLAGRAELLAPSDEVEAFAEEATEGASGARENAEAVTEALRKRAKQDAFTVWPLNEPRDGPVRTAEETMKRVAEDGGKAHLYPLEVAALAVAALRAVDVDAMIAEAWTFAGERAPPDPSGFFGYYVVALPSGEGDPGDAPLVDPYGGRDLGADSDARRVLTDVEAVAAAFAHDAMHELRNEGNVNEAFSLSDHAIALDPRSPAIRTVRAFVLLQSGGVEEGLDELQSATQLREDAPQLKNLAAIHMAQGDVDAAAREVSKALSAYPDYADAHATLAQIHLAKGELDLARSELAAAEDLNPSLPTLPLLWAQVHVNRGELERAAERAREAIEERPHHWQSRLQAAQILRQAGYYDEMRREAQKILELVPGAREQEIKKLIGQVLGPTAFDPVVAEGSGEADGGAALGSGEFDLSRGSMLLGDGEGAAQGGSLGTGSLLGEDGPGATGDPLLSPGSGSTLRLREPGESLQLDLKGE